MTFLSLALSPEPAKGSHAGQKVISVPIGLLAAAFVTTEERARNTYELLGAAGAIFGCDRHPSNFRSHK